MAPKMEFYEEPFVEDLCENDDLHVDLMIEEEDEGEWNFEEGPPMELFARHVAQHYEEGSIVRRCFDKMMTLLNSGELNSVDFIETVLIVFESDEDVMNNIHSLLDVGASLRCDAQGRWSMDTGDTVFVFARREDVIELARRFGTSVPEFILATILS